MPTTSDHSPVVPLDKVDEDGFEQFLTGFTSSNGDAKNLAILNPPTTSFHPSLADEFPTSLHLSDNHNVISSDSKDGTLLMDWTAFPTTTPELLNPSWPASESLPTGVLLPPPSHTIEPATTMHIDPQSSQEETLEEQNKRKRTRTRKDPNFDYGEASIVQEDEESDASVPSASESSASDESDVETPAVKGATRRITEDGHVVTHSINAVFSQKRKKRPTKEPTHDESGELVYCVCREGDDGSFMIQCDTCSEWFHGHCVGISRKRAKSIETYECVLCALYNYDPNSVESKTIKTKRSTPSSASKLRSRESSSSSREAAQRQSSARSSRDKALAVLKKQKTSTPKVSEAEQKKTNESTRKVVRRGFAETFKAIFDLVLLCRKPESEISDEDREKFQWLQGVEVTSDLNLQDSRYIAVDIEEEMFKLFAEPSGECGSKYKAKYRSLQFNLKDEKNSRLRRRILTGEVTPVSLVSLPPEELASEKVAVLAEQVRKQSIQSAVRPKSDETTVIAKTHKGDVEIVLSTSSTEKTESSNLTKSIIKEEEAVAGVETMGSGRVESLEDILARMGGGIEDIKKSADGIESKKRPFESESSSFSTLVSTPDAHEDDASPPVSPKLPAKKLKTDDDTVQTSETHFDMFTSSAVESPQQAPDSPCLPPYTPPSDDAGSQTNDALLSHTEAVWHGKLQMAQVGRCSTWCAQVAGVPVGDAKAWEDVLPAALSIDGRIASDRVLDYLAQQRQSANKEIVVIEFKLEGNQDVEPTQADKDGYKALFDYFHSRNRYAVVGHHYVSVKDMYIMPIGKDDALPEFLTWLPGGFIIPERERDRDMLLGIIIILKDVLRGNAPPPVVRKERRPHRQEAPRQPVISSVPPANPLLGADLSALSALLASTSSIVQNVSQPASYQQPAQAPLSNDLLSTLQSLLPKK